MTEPTAPNIPADAPQDVKDFFDCKGNTMLWAPGEVTWLGLGANPSVTFEHGSVPGSINIGVSALGGLLSFTLPASVNAAGELVVDTSAVPDLSALGLGGRSDVDAAIKRINDWFKHNGKKLKPATLKKGVVTLEKTAIGAAPAVAPVPQTTPAPTPKPAPPPKTPPPTGGTTTETTGGWCSSMFVLLTLLFVGVIALGGGIGLMFFGSPAAPPEASPTAVAVVPTPTNQPSTSPSATPSSSPTRSPTPSPSPSPSPSPTPTPSQPPAATNQPSIAFQVTCVRVVHERIGQFVSYLQWVVDVSVNNVDYFEITVVGANGGQPQRLEFDSREEAFVGLLGLSQAGDKSIVEVIAHMDDGSEIDVIEPFLDVFGGDTFTVRFPQEDEFGNCPP